MEKDMEEECVRLRLDVFVKYWSILKSNYKDTQHTEFDFKYYYSIFREYEEKDFINAIKMVLKYQSYFPRIDEIVKYLPQIDNLQEEYEKPAWFNENLEIKKPTNDELLEIENIVKEIGG